MHLKRTILALAVLAALGFAFGQEPYVWDTAEELAEPELAQQGGTLSIATLSGSRTWNIVMSREQDDARDLGMEYAQLLTTDNETFEWKPYAAESFEISEDGRQVTVRVREGVKWSDGDPITAADYMLFYTTTQDPAVESPNADAFVMGDDVVQLEMVDEMTLRYTFPRPTRTALFTVAITTPVPDHILGEIYRNEGAEAFRNAWGTDTPLDEIVWDGPYMVTQYSPDERYTLTKNPAFAEWNVDSNGTPLPYIETIQMTIAEQDAQLNLYLAGETDIYSPNNLDAVGVVANAINTGELDAVLAANLYPTAGWLFYVFNWNLASDPVKQEIFRSRQFRQAMSHLTPRDAIVDLVFGGAAKPHYGPVAEANTLFYQPVEDQVRFEFDPEAALELLAEIGFTERNEDGWLVDAEGNVLEYRLVTNSGNAVREQMIQVIADTQREYGVKVETEALDFNLLVDQLLSTGEDRPWEAIYISIDGGSIEWPFSESLYNCQAGSLHTWNTSGDCLVPQEQLISQLQQRGEGTLDDAAAQEIANEIQSVFGSLQPAITTVAQLAHASWATDVGGHYRDEVINAYNGTRSLVTTFKK